MKVRNYKMATVGAAMIALTAAASLAYAEEQTTVYGGVSINTSNGHVTPTAGASYSQTHGNSTTTVDVHTNGKTVDVQASKTTQTGR
jgi:hypothetical protein